MESIVVETHPKPLVGASYYCPHCLSVLSVSIDPQAIADDIVSDLQKGERED
jgi:hypothetical protein